MPKYDRVKPKAHIITAKAIHRYGILENMGGPIRYRKPARPSIPKAGPVRFSRIQYQRAITPRAP